MRTCDMRGALSRTQGLKPCRPHAFMNTHPRISSLMGSPLLDTHNKAECAEEDMRRASYHKPSA